MANELRKTLDQRLAEIKSAPVCYKQFAIDSESKAIDVEQRTATFIITTDGVDRDGDTVSSKGWDIGNFVKSPVVLWAHDYSQPPVARALSIRSTTRGLESTCQFPAKGVYPFADTVFELLKGGFLSATSVGFRPVEFARDEKREGVNFTKQELLEYSIVPVPANPEALVVARSKGIDVAPVVEWAEKTMAAFGTVTTASDAAVLAVLKALPGKLAEDAGLRKAVRKALDEGDVEDKAACDACGKVHDDGACEKKAALKDDSKADEADEDEGDPKDVVFVEDEEEDEDEPEDHPDRAAEDADKTFVLRLLPNPEPLISKAEVSDALRTSVLNTLSALVREQVSTAFAQSRGRID